jgi:hypothetical protein
MLHDPKTIFSLLSADRKNTGFELKMKKEDPAAHRYKGHNPQSMRVFRQESPELGPHTPPHPQASVSPTLVPGYTLACKRGGGGFQFGQGDSHCGTLGIQYMCFVALPHDLLYFSVQKHLFCSHQPF